MDRFQFYKGLFDRELQRRHDIDAQTNLPVTAYTIIAAIIMYCSNNVNFINSTFWVHVMNILFGFGVLAYITGLVFLILVFNKFFLGHDYKNLADPEKLSRYEKKIRLPEIQISPNTKSSNKSFEDGLITKYISLGTYNTKINDYRGEKLFLSKSCIVLTILSLSIFFIITSLFEL